MDFMGAMKKLELDQRQVRQSEREKALEIMNECLKGFPVSQATNPFCLRLLRLVFNIFSVQNIHESELEELLSLCFFLFNYFPENYKSLLAQESFEKFCLPLAWKLIEQIDHKAISIVSKSLRTLNCFCEIIPFVSLAKFYPGLCSRIFKRLFQRKETSSDVLKAAVRLNQTLLSSQIHKTSGNSPAKNPMNQAIREIAKEVFGKSDSNQKKLPCEEAMPITTKKHYEILFQFFTSSKHIVKQYRMDVQEALLESFVHIYNHIASPNPICKKILPELFDVVLLLLSLVFKDKELLKKKMEEFLKGISHFRVFEHCLEELLKNTSILPKLANEIDDSVFSSSFLQCEILGVALRTMIRNSKDAGSVFSLGEPEQRVVLSSLIRVLRVPKGQLTHSKWNSSIQLSFDSSCTEEFSLGGLASGPKTSIWFDQARSIFMKNNVKKAQESYLDFLGQWIFNSYSTLLPGVNYSSQQLKNLMKLTQELPEPVHFLLYEVTVSLIHKTEGLVDELVQNHQENEISQVFFEEIFQEEKQEGIFEIRTWQDLIETLSSLQFLLGGVLAGKRNPGQFQRPFNESLTKQLISVEFLSKIKRLLFLDTTGGSLKGKSAGLSPWAHIVQASFFWLLCHSVNQIAQGATSFPSHRLSDSSLREVKSNQSNPSFDSVETGPLKLRFDQLGRFVSFCLSEYFYKSEIQRTFIELSLAFLADKMHFGCFQDFLIAHVDFFFGNNTKRLENIGALIDKKRPIWEAIGTIQVYHELVSHISTRGALQKRIETHLLSWSRVIVGVIDVYHTQFVSGRQNGSLLGLFIGALDNIVSMLACVSEEPSHREENTLNSEEKEEDKFGNVLRQVLLRIKPFLLPQLGIAPKAQISTIGVIKASIPLLRNRPMALTKSEERFSQEESENVTISNSLGAIMFEFHHLFLSVLRLEKNFFVIKALVDCLGTLAQNYHRFFLNSNRFRDEYCPILLEVLSKIKSQKLTSLNENVKKMTQSLLDFGQAVGGEIAHDLINEARFLLEK